MVAAEQTKSLGLDISWTYKKTNYEGNRLTSIVKIYIGIRNN